MLRSTLIVAFGILLAQPPHRGLTEEMYTASDINQGRQLLNSLCSRCHGIDGRGAKGPDLTDGVFRHAKTDQDIHRIINDGIPGTGMAGFGEGYEDWNQMMIVYMRSEAKRRGNLAAQRPAGNPARGMELFNRHQCASCHWTGSEGGRIGTNLTQLAATPTYIANALQDPDSQRNSEYQLVVLTMHDGRVIEGRRLNENSYVILLMVRNNDNLRTFAKDEIAKIDRPHLSLMPNYRNSLDEQDINDLTTYLYSIPDQVAR